MRGVERACAASALEAREQLLLVRRVGLEQLEQRLCRSATDRCELLVFHATRRLCGREERQTGYEYDSRPCPASPKSASPALLAALAAAPPARGGADVYFEQTTVVARGRPCRRAPASPRGSGTRAAACGWRPATAPGGPAFILRLDQGKAYRLDPERKRAIEIDLERLRAQRADGPRRGRRPDGRRTRAPAQTTPLRTARRSPGYACRGFRITAGSGDAWTST